MNNQDCEIVSKRVMELMDELHIPPMCYVKALLLTANTIYEKNNKSEFKLKVEFYKPDLEPSVIDVDVRAN